MPSVKDYIAAEKAKVASVFEEEVELTPYDMRRTYTDFRVTAVNGHRAEHRILVSLYDDQIYIDPKNRRPWRRLTVSDLDVRVRYGQVGNHANKVLRVMNEGRSVGEAVPEELAALARKDRPEAGLLVDAGTKLSLRFMLEEAYQLGGYGEFPDRKNSNGVTPEDARELADQAIGPADRPVVSAERAGERSIWRYREGGGVESAMGIDDLLSEIVMTQSQDPFDDGFIHRCTRVCDDGRRDDAGFRVSEQPSQLLIRLGREGQALCEVSERNNDLIWRFAAQTASGNYGYEVETRVLPHGVLALMGSLGYATDDARAAISGDRFEARYAALSAIWDQCSPIGAKIADIAAREAVRRSPASVAAAARAKAASAGQAERRQARGQKH